jgi:hypothetical protein
MIFGVALLAAAAQPAAAQSWTEFADPDAGFTVQLPAQPKKEAGSYDVILDDGRRISVPAIVYSVRDANNFYTTTVADFLGTPADQPHAVDRAIDAIRGTGNIKLDLPTSVANSACGRDLVVDDRDGGRSTLALFFQNTTNHRLYVFRAKAAPPNIDEGGADAIQFQQSVNFIGSAASKDVPESADDQIWKKYVYHASRFAIRFPAEPKVTAGTYTTAGGVRVNTLEYTVRQRGALYRVIVADLWHTPADKLSAIDQAVSLLRRKATIKLEQLVNIPGGQCGLDLSLVDRDGRPSIATVVFPTASHWLYIIEAKAVSSDRATAEADMSRFRRSFRLYWNLDGTPPSGQ